MPSRKKNRAKAPGQTADPATNGRAEDLLGGLERIFLREGFRRVTVGDLASHLHCSRRALYDLAPGKRELFLLVLDRVLGRIDRLGRDGAAAGHAHPGRIANFIRPGLTQLRAGAPIFFADVASLAAARQRLAGHQESRRRQLCDLIEEGVRSGVCRNLHAEVAAQSMLAVYRAVTDPGFLSSVDVSMTDAIQEAQDLMLQGLLNR